MNQGRNGRLKRLAVGFAAVAALAVTLVGVGASPASAADVTVVRANTAPITIPDSGSANPYPSTINVSGLGNLTGLEVTIKNTVHGCGKDLDVLLVGPTGIKTTLFSDNGHAALLVNCSDLTKTSIRIADSCPDFGNSTPSGANICVRPSDNDAFGHQGDSWPGVGNDFPALNLSTFYGTNPNGAWNLYVVDDAGDDSGAFSGGWELKLTGANANPTAHSQVIDAYKGQAVPFTVTGSDPEGGALTCLVPATTVSAKGTLGGSGCARTYTAGARTTGTDKVAIRVADPNGSQSAPAEIAFNIVNRLPVATDKVVNVGRGERMAISLGGVDPDAGESLALTCSPTLGATGLGSVSGSGCNVTYAAGNTNGTESFPFVVNDGFGGTDSGTITVNVVDPVLPGCAQNEPKNARYVCRVYGDLLGRAPDAGGKAFWLAKLNAGEDRVGIIRKFQTTPEYNRSVVKGVYATFLQRVPDMDGQVFWADKLRKGANPDEIRVLVISSSEYWNKAGGSSAGFAAAIYQQVTRTPATQAQVDSVMAKLKAGASKASIASALLATREGDTATVKAIYESYLRRTPPSIEVTFWVDKLQAKVTELKIVESTISSNEYYNRA